VSRASFKNPAGSDEMFAVLGLRIQFLTMLSALAPLDKTVTEAITLLRSNEHSAGAVTLACAHAKVLRAMPCLCTGCSPTARPGRR
jgi:hypothetical protein